MSEQAVRPVETFNLLDPAVLDDPFDFYRALLTQAPVHWAPEANMYIVSRYDDLRAILQDTETYSNRLDASFLQGENFQVYQDILAEKGWLDVNTLNSADPPEHQRYRRIADQVFNARRVEAIAPRIASIVDSVIDRFIDRGECDFVADFAFPMVGTVISEQLGLDASQMHTFKRWGDAIMLLGARPLTREELRENALTIVEMQQFIAAKLEERRKEPKGDLISALILAGSDEAEPLTMAELQSLMRQFLSGTYESLVSALGHGLWLLLRFPDQMALLRSDPALIPEFVEEVLRFDSAVPGLARIVTRDCELHGVKLSKGAMIMPRYAAANHDPAKFSCPHVFDIQRSDKAHISFGTGPHICVGRVLARQEMRMAFAAILDRMDDIRLARPLQDIAHVPHLMLRPLKELPISFRRRDASSGDREGRAM